MDLANASISFSYTNSKMIRLPIMLNNDIDFSKYKANNTLHKIFNDYFHEIDDAIKCSNKTDKHLRNNCIAGEIYDIFVYQYNGRFYKKTIAPYELTKVQAVIEIIPRMVKYIHCQNRNNKRQENSKRKKVNVMRGFAFNDFAKLENNEKTHLEFLPLHTPDLIFDQYGKRKYESKDTAQKRYTKRMKTVDRHKFKKGANHYVNGFCYSSPVDNPGNLFFINKDKFEKTDLIFEIAGTCHYTSVKIRKVKDDHPILANIKAYEKMGDSHINIGGNARHRHFSHVKGKHFMFSMAHHTKGQYKGRPSLPVRNWNSIDSDFSSESFAKLLESAMFSEFPETLDRIKELEKDEKVNFLGEYAHSIDISVNLVNAPHFDMGDYGYGIGLWLSSDSMPNPNWYFILPNASINGSHGVAIKLDHGIMIEWNGTEIKHCSSDPGYNKNQTLFGTFIGPKKNFCSSSQKKEEPLIPKINDLEEDKKRAFASN